MQHVAWTVTVIRTKFHLSPTAVATVSHEFCPLHGMLNDAMFHTTHLSRRLKEHWQDKLSERLHWITGQKKPSSAFKKTTTKTYNVCHKTLVVPIIPFFAVVHVFESCKLYLVAQEVDLKIGLPFPIHILRNRTSLQHLNVMQTLACHALIRLLQKSRQMRDICKMRVCSSL